MRRCHAPDLDWDRTCPHCGAVLLRGEVRSFCCGNGSKIAPPLPPLPPRLQQLILDGVHRNKLSTLSRKLNSLFSFSAIGVTDEWAHFQTGPASVAITGRVYHRIFDAAQPNHSIHWYLYDELEREQKGTAVLKLPLPWIRSLKADLDDVNPYVHRLRQFQSVPQHEPVALELTDVSMNGDFAAIMHAANSTTVKEREILIWRNASLRPTYIKITNRHYEPLQYPLLFPHGTPGWGKDDHPCRLTAMQWCRSRVLTDRRFLTFGRLTAEYLCDMYSRIEEQRLGYIKQARISSAHERDPDLPDHEEIKIDLPSSFLGSRRWASEQAADALALARKKGKASFFITFTCNSDWPEIRSQLSPGQTASDVPVVVARAFKQRLQKFLHLLRSRFGNLIYMIKVIEFQKRGLPHAHIILKVRVVSKHLSSSSPLLRQVHPELPLYLIDSLISCRLPTDNPQLRDKIKKYMTHSPDHLTRETSRCRKGNRCIYDFPHPITPTTWIDEDSGKVHYRRDSEEDRWIAPHVPEFIDKFDCHIYWDIVFTITVFMYLYKYMYKGPDHTLFHVPNPQPVDDHAVDETKDYVDGRYLSAPEAAWRILGFDVTSKEPSVTCLPVHLPGQNIPQFFQGDNRLSSSASLLIRYFHRPSLQDFDALLYTDYYEQYLFQKTTPHTILREHQYLEQPIPNTPQYIVSRRQRGEKITRIQMLSPSLGEVFYVRALLACRAVRSFEDLRTIEGTAYDSFQEAATVFGIFRDINEGTYALEEAVLSLQTPAQLRFLFSRIILEGYVAIPLWDRFHLDMSRDYIVNLRSEVAGVNQCLTDLSRLLADASKHLTDFGLPEPYDIQRWSAVQAEQAIFEGRRGELQLDAERKAGMMNAGQAYACDAILDHILPGFARQPIFLDGKPGRGKTFVVDAISDLLRSQSKIVLTCASSALAASNYERGRTAHSLFGIPVHDVSSPIPCH